MFSEIRRQKQLHGTRRASFHLEIYIFHRLLIIFASIHFVSPFSTSVSNIHIHHINMPENDINITATYSSSFKEINCTFSHTELNAASNQSMPRFKREGKYVRWDPFAFIRRLANGRATVTSFPRPFYPITKKGKSVLHYHHPEMKGQSAVLLPDYKLLHSHHPGVLIDAKGMMASQNENGEEVKRDNVNDNEERSQLSYYKPAWQANPLDDSSPNKFASNGEELYNPEKFQNKLDQPLPKYNSRDLPVYSDREVYSDYQNNVPVDSLKNYDSGEGVLSKSGRESVKESAPDTAEESAPGGGLPEESDPKSNEETEPVDEENAEEEPVDTFENMNVPMSNYDSEESFSAEGDEGNAEKLDKASGSKKVEATNLGSGFSVKQNASQQQIKARRTDHRYASSRRRKKGRHRLGQYGRRYYAARRRRPWGARRKSWRYRNRYRYRYRPSSRRRRPYYRYRNRWYGRNSRRRNRKKYRKKIHKTYASRLISIVRNAKRQREVPAATIEGVTSVVFVLKGSNVNFACTDTPISKGYTIQWSRSHGEPIVDSRFTMSKSGVLNIVSAQSTDSEIYICKVKETGKAYKHVLEVYLPPEPGYEVKWQYVGHQCHESKLPEIKSAVHSKLKDNVCGSGKCDITEVRVDCAYSTTSSVRYSSISLRSRSEQCKV